MVLVLCLSFVLLVQSAVGLECFGQTCDSHHPVCKVDFGHGVPTGGSCDKQHQHGNHPQCGHILPDHGHCHCDDKFCVQLVYTFMAPTPTTEPTTQASAQQPAVTTGAPTAQPIVTTQSQGPVQQPTSQAARVCADQHAKCTDTVYQQILCKATMQSTHEYAVKTCPLSCNLCSQYFAYLNGPVLG